MNKPAALHQIDFVLTDILGEKHTFSLIPMKTKIAHNILHNVLLTVLETVAGALREEITDDEMITEMIKGLKTLDFDSFWYIAERVLKNAVVDGTSFAKNLEDITWTKKDPTLLYKAVYEGIKGNYPDVFLLLGLEDLFRPSKEEKEEKDTQAKK